MVHSIKSHSPQHPRLHPILLCNPTEFNRYNPSSSGPCIRKDKSVVGANDCRRWCAGGKKIKNLQEVARLILRPPSWTVFFFVYTYDISKCPQLEDLS